MTTAGDRNACLLCGRIFTAAALAYPVAPDLVFGECAACGVAVRRRPADAAALYDDAYARDITAGFRSEGARRHALATLRRLARLQPGRGRLLDVGCAGGDFLLSAREAGWSVRGVEMQPRSAELARSRGLAVDSPDIGRVPAGAAFDAITLLDVFEHLADPAAFLSRAASLLAERGILYIEMPNYGSVFRRLLGRRWMAFLPQHECLYSAAALRRVLERAGFDVVLRTTYACSPLSYDGLRRLRIHRRCYDAGLLMAAAARRMGMARGASALAGLGRRLGAFLNWPLEELVGRLALAGDQLIVVARRGRRAGGRERAMSAADPIRRERLGESVAATVVIPSTDGDRGGNVARLLDDLRAQSFRDLEILLVVGISPQGRAINLGAAAAAGETLVILDDDSRVRDPRVIATLVALLREHPDVGMAGASIVQPGEATPFQRRVAREFPRFNMPVVGELTDSDMPCHGCCAMRREVFEAIGREPEDIVRGIDPVVRQRLRERGWRIVLAPRIAVSHPVPGSLRDLARMFFRNGRGSAYIQRRRPDLVLDTDESVALGGRPLRSGIVYRLARFPLRWLGHLFGGRPFRALGDFVYVAGYAWEWTVGRGES